MGVGIRRALGVCVLGVLLGVAPAAGGAPTRGHAAEGPFGFFGMTAGGLPSADEFTEMASGGVQTYRAQLAWQAVEARRGTFDWSFYDELVARAAAAHINVA